MLVMPLELILMRHAKTEAGAPGLSDFERALVARGEADAATMAQRLLNRHVQPHLLVSSPARRAISTARLVAPVLGILPQAIVEQAALYHASVATWVEVINHLPAEAGQVLCFGHNEGITELAQQLSSTAIDHLPTAGVFGVRLSCERWADFEADGSHEFWFADWPKNGG